MAQETESETGPLRLFSCSSKPLERGAGKTDILFDSGIDAREVFQDGLLNGAQMPERKPGRIPAGTEFKMVTRTGFEPVNACVKGM